MTEDQITAIAEEYIHWASKNPKDWPYLRKVSDVEIVLKFLNKKYCIVEREKVMELYRDSEKLMDVYPSMSNGLANKLTTMEQLFGTSMFNQNEE